MRCDALLYLQVIVAVANTLILGAYFHCDLITAHLNCTCFLVNSTLETIQIVGKQFKQGKILVFLVPLSMGAILWLHKPQASNSRFVILLLWGLLGAAYK